MAADTLSKPRKDNLTGQTNPLLYPLTETDQSGSPGYPSWKFSLTFLFLCLILSLGHATGDSSSPSSNAKPHKKLTKPVVLMISCDGFRFGYQFKTETPNIDRLIAGGTEAKRGLIPVFPTMTFPNHYSIATGLYPAYHGIVMNRFTDPITGKTFTKTDLHPEWWLGEPLWVTVVNQGLKAATYFWPGSEVHKGSWNCPEKFCKHYNISVPLEERVDTVLSYFDLPEDDIPDFIMLYFQEPDRQGHEYGPDDPRVTSAVARIDKLIGRIITGLKQRKVFDDVNVILLGDHGMVTNCDKKVIYINDLADWIKIPEDWIQSYSPVLAIRPVWDKNMSLEVISKKNAEVVAKMNKGLSSGKVENGELLQVYLKEKLPKRLHYSASDRIPPIIGMVGEGIYVKQNRTNVQECFGDHGYDNKFFSMRSIFIGHGPRFKTGKKVPSFENVQIYNVVADILSLRPAPNNGSSLFPQTMLLPNA